MRPLESPSLMAWAALAVRLVGFAVVLPAALAQLSSAEVSVWLLFSTITSLQLLVDFGFGATFSREIAYGFAGGSTLAPTAQSRVPKEEARPDWASISRTMAAMRWLYRRLGLATLLLLATLGTLAVARPIGRIEVPVDGWLGWIVIVGSTASAIIGNANSSFLLGANRIAQMKRWEACNGLAFIPLQVVVLLAGGGLLGLVLAAQAGVLSQVLINWVLARRMTAGHTGEKLSRDETRAVVRGLWPAAWRTAVGTISSFGVHQGMAIAMANVLAAGEAASVQVALRLVQIISQFSQVPFYTKIPVFNRLRAMGADADLMALVNRAIRLSLGLFVAAAIATDLAIRPILDLVGSQTTFPSPLFWLLLALAGLFERIGAMHVQLLMTSNRMIAHIANVVTAVAWIGATVALWPSLAATALPLGMLIAYAGFYAPWSSYKSRASMDPEGGLAFELRTSALPVAVLAAYFAIAML